MNQIYGFEGEVKAKYTAQMYELFSEVFEWLPLAQCINGKVLVRSLGLSHRAGNLPVWGRGGKAGNLPVWGRGQEGAPSSQRHVFPLDHAWRPVQRRWCHSG